MLYSDSKLLQNSHLQKEYCTFCLKILLISCYYLFVFQKISIKKNIFVGVCKVIDEKSRIRSRSRIRLSNRRIRGSAYTSRSVHKMSWIRNTTLIFQQQNLLLCFDEKCLILQSLTLQSIALLLRTRLRY